MIDFYQHNESSYNVCIRIDGAMYYSHPYKNEIERTEALNDLIDRIKTKFGEDLTHLKNTQK